MNDTECFMERRVNRATASIMGAVREIARYDVSLISNSLKDDVGKIIARLRRVEDENKMLKETVRDAATIIKTRAT